MRRTLLLMAILLLMPALLHTAQAGSTEDTPTVIISEFFPDPAGSDLSAEFVEIMNAGNGPVNIAGWYITDSDGPIDFTFPDLTLNPGERAVVYSGNSSFRWSGGHEFFMNRSTSMLNNDGDDISLCDSDGNLMDYVRYGNGSMVDGAGEGEWESAPDQQTGLSLARIGDMGEWVCAMPTPGLENPEEGADVELSAIYPVARYSDEFFALRNAGDGPADISGYMLTDGEGYLYLPPGTVLAAGEEIYITQNLSGFISEMGFSADMGYSECYTPSCFPQMSNEGDSLELVSPAGQSMSSLDYSASVPPRGYYLYFNGMWQERKAGWDYLSPLNLNFTGEAIAYSSPENSYQVLSYLIGNSRESLVVNTYSFEDTALAAQMAAACERGVSVRVFVEGSPVGGMDEREREVLSMLSSAGADVRIKNNTDRYRYDHAKYMVIDGEWAVIQSENLNPDALSENATWGNRGWGIALRSPEIADYLTGIFMHDSDLNFSDVERYRGSSDVPAGTYHLGAPEISDITANISVLPGPYAGLQEVMDAIDSAQSEVFVEQFYITHYWRYGNGQEENPLLSALISAAERGCRVRVLLDGEDYNTDGDDDNDEIAGYLNSIADEKGLDMEARVINSSAHHLIKVHNKGMVIDGRRALVSSFNWGQNSFTYNREMAILIENEDIAGYYRSLFMQDWKNDLILPVARISGDIAMYVNESALFTSASTDNSGISETLWYLDGSLISENGSVSLNFSAPGRHTLTIVVSDPEGNRNSSTMELIVMEIPPMPETDVPEEDAGKSPAAEPAETDATPESTPQDSEAPEPDSMPAPSYLYYLLIIPAALVLAAASRISRSQS